MIFGVGDTEDTSQELMDAGLSGFDKEVTLLAAVTSDGEKYHNFGSVEKYLEWLKGQYIVKEWYFHNLAYDLGNLFGDDLDELDLIMVGGRLIRAHWQGIRFVNSLNLFPTSVRKLGEDLGLEDKGAGKLKMDIRDPDYVYRDCDIVKTGVETMLRTANGYKLNRLSPTLGGLCVKLWKSMGGRNWHDNSALSDEAMFGGRVEIFRPNGSGNIAWVDINSLYPWAMTQKFPVGAGAQPDLCDFGVSRVTIQIPDQPIAPLPYRVRENEIPGVGAGSIIFPCGTLTGVWVNLELKNAIKHHGVKILKFHEGCGSNKGDVYYGRFVAEFYRNRLKAIKDNNKSNSLIYKLLMNNLYGQLGMSGRITRTTRNLDEKVLRDVAEGKKEGRAFGTNFLLSYRTPLPEHVNYMHAAHVTAYGRVRLLEFIRKIDPGNLLYCDTDSIFFFHPEKTPLPFKIDEGLGQMKIESWGKRAVLHAPKTYEFDGKAKAKGVPKKFQKEFIEKRWAEYTTPYRLREAIEFFDREVIRTDRHGMPVYAPKARGNAKKLSVWRRVRKEFKAVYHKKKLIDGNQWIPLHLTLEGNTTPNKRNNRK